MSDRNARFRKSVAHALRRVFAAAMLALLGYAAAGMIGGAIPSNAGWRAPATGVRIFVETNGIHTGFILPKVAAGVDWRPLVPARDLADPRYAAFDHVAVGWGEQTFYLETPTWADVKLTTIAAAATGSRRVLIHAEHLPEPRVADDVRAVTLRPEEYRRLARFIRASWVVDGRRYPGYAGYDVFYQGRGQYSALATCNDWTGDALRHAGVRVGAWTPFPVIVMGWF